VGENTIEERGIAATQCHDRRMPAATGMGNFSCPFISMISIRPPQLADARMIARCHVAAWRDSYRPQISETILSQPSVEEDYVAKWTGRLAEPNNRIFVAQHDSGELLGFILGGRERTGRTDYQGEVFSVYVLKEYRSQGIGRALFQRLAGSLLEHGLASAIVWVFEENPCRQCYAAWGGEQVATKAIKVGEQQLVQVAYGWRDLGSAGANWSTA
jgi:GNAT superfamily N-acetyltransferase